jgi:hypothetical protein
MNSSIYPLPAHTHLCNSPQLSTLAVLEAALLATKAALAAAHYQLAYFDSAPDPSRPRSVALAATILRLSSRLAAALDDYRDATHREFRRSAGARIPF